MLRLVAYAAGILMMFCAASAAKACFSWDEELVSPWQQYVAYNNCPYVVKITYEVDNLLGGGPSRHSVDVAACRTQQFGQGEKSWVYGNFKTFQYPQDPDKMCMNGYLVDKPTSNANNTPGGGRYQPIDPDPDPDPQYANNDPDPDPNYNNDPDPDPGFAAPQPRDPNPLRCPAEPNAASPRPECWDYWKSTNPGKWGGVTVDPEPSQNGDDLDPDLGNSILKML